jgi:hypothetical protein
VGFHIAKLLSAAHFAVALPVLLKTRIADTLTAMTNEASS